MGASAFSAGWIRVSRGAKTDPKIGALADRLDVAHEAALGLLVNLWLEMAEHARDGAIAGVDDLTLERWAGWRGHRRRFATAFRELFQTKDGLVNAWDRHNGRALARAERERDRVAEWREAERVRKCAPNADGNAKRTRAELGDETRRDERDEPTSHRPRTPHRRGSPVHDAPGEAPPGSARGPEARNGGGWPAEFAAALEPIGQFPPGRVGRAIGPVVKRYGPERAREMLAAFVQLGPHQRTDGKFDPEVRSHQFCTPERFAQTAGFWAQHTEPITDTVQA